MLRLPTKHTPLFISSIFRPRLLSNLKHTILTRASNKEHQVDPYAEQRSLLQLLGVNSQVGPLPNLDRPTLPGEYAISRERCESIFKDCHKPTEEEYRANGEILKKASRHPSW